MKVVAKAALKWAVYAKDTPVHIIKLNVTFFPFFASTIYLFSWTDMQLARLPSRNSYTHWYDSPDICPIQGMRNVPVIFFKSFVYLKLKGP